MINFELRVLEDHISKKIVEDFDLPRACAPHPLLDYWSKALKRTEGLPCCKNPKLNEEMAPFAQDLKSLEIEVYLCSRDSMESFALSETDQALGVHLVSNPDFLPFPDEGPYAEKYRVLCVSCKDEFLAYIKDEADKDLFPQDYISEYLSSYLTTVFHEISHAILFAENAHLLPPSQVNSLSDAGESSRDIFDCATGYGIRPLKIAGQDCWSETMDQASEIMEIYVEERGRKMMEAVLTDDLDTFSFLKVLGVEEEVQSMLDEASEKHTT